MRNKIDGDILKEIRRKLQVEFEALSKVRHKLERRDMSVVDLMRILHFSRRQAVYSYSILSETAGSKAKKKQTWHRFSILDLVAFAVLKELKGLRVPLVASKKLLTYIHRNIATGKQLLYSLSDGYQVALNLTGDNIDHTLGVEITKAPYAILKVGSTTTIIVALYPAFKYILQNIKRKDFFVKFVADASGKKSRIIYFVDGEQIELRQLGCLDFSIDKDKK